MSKKRNIAHSLSLCAQRVLPLIQGVFEWNGELCACPFITFEDKEKPLQLRTWIREYKNRNNWPIFFEKNHPMIIFFADPINPRTFQKWRRYSMDMSCGIDESSKVYITGNHTMTIKNGERVDVIRFIRKITDNERLKFFPMDDHGNFLRTVIFLLSKPGAMTDIKGYSLERALKEWDAYCNLEKVQYTA